MKSQLDLYLEQYENGNQIESHDNNILHKKCPTTNNNNIDIFNNIRSIGYTYVLSISKLMVNLMALYGTKLICYSLDGMLIDIYEIIDHSYHHHNIIHNNPQYIKVMNPKIQSYSIINNIRRFLYIIIIFYLSFGMILNKEIILYSSYHSLNMISLLTYHYFRLSIICMLLAMLLIPIFLGFLWNHLLNNQLLSITREYYTMNMNYITILKCIQLVNLGRNITYPLPPISKLEDKLFLCSINNQHLNNSNNSNNHIKINKDNSNDNNNINKDNSNDDNNISKDISSVSENKSLHIYSCIELRYHFYSSLYQLQYELNHSYVTKQTKLKNIIEYLQSWEYQQIDHSYDNDINTINYDDIIINFYQFFHCDNDNNDNNQDRKDQNIVTLSQIDNIHKDIYNNQLKTLPFQYYYIIKHCVVLCYRIYIKYINNNSIKTIPNILIIIYLYLKIFLYLYELLLDIVNDIKILKKYKNKCHILEKYLKQKCLVNNINQPSILNENSDINNNDNDNNNNGNKDDNSGNRDNINSIDCSNNTSLIKLDELYYQNNIYHKVLLSLSKIRNEYDTWSYRLWLCQDILSKLSTVSRTNSKLATVTTTTTTTTTTTNSDNSDSSTILRPSPNNFEIEINLLNDVLHKLGGLSLTTSNRFNNNNNCNNNNNNINHNNNKNHNNNNHNNDNNDINNIVQSESELLDAISTSMKYLPTISHYQELINHIVLLQKSYLGIDINNQATNKTSIEDNPNNLFHERDPSTNILEGINNHQDQDQTSISTYSIDAIYEEIGISNNIKKEVIEINSKNMIDIYTTIIPNHQIKNELHNDSLYKDKFNEDNASYHKSNIHSKSLLLELKDQFKMFYNTKSSVSSNNLDNSTINNENNENDNTYHQLNIINKIIPSHTIARTHQLEDNNIVSTTTIEHYKEEHIVTNNHQIQINNNNNDIDDNNSYNHDKDNMIQIGSILIPKDQIQDQQLLMLSAYQHTHHSNNSYNAMNNMDSSNSTLSNNDNNANNCYHILDSNNKMISIDDCISRSKYLSQEMLQSNILFNRKLANKQSEEIISSYEDDNSDENNNNE